MNCLVHVVGDRMYRRSTVRVAAVAAVLATAASVSADTGYVGYGPDVSYSGSVSGGGGFNYWGQRLLSFKTGSTSEYLKTLSLLNTEVTSAAVTVRFTFYAVADDYDVVSNFNFTDSANNGSISDGNGGTYSRGQFFDLSSSTGSNWMTYDLTQSQFGTFSLNTDTRYLVHLQLMSPNMYLSNGGSQNYVFGDDGWSTVGGSSLAGGLTGMYSGYAGNVGATSTAWLLGFNSNGTPAVPGPGVAMAAIFGLAGARRRRR